MESQPDVMVGTLGESTRSYRLARKLSNVFHPMILSTINLLVVGLFSRTEWWLVGLGWALLCMLLQIVPATVFFTVRLKQGAYTDEDVSVRQQRNELYIFSLGLLGVNLVLLWLLSAPVDFLALLTGGIVVSAAAWMINLYWKISVHAATAASTAVVCLLYAPLLGALMAVGALVVGWARVRTSNHTLLQVLAGYALATVGVLLVFGWFGLV
jgi:membrane-associated phospholipid phosphatase